MLASGKGVNRSKVTVIDLYAFERLNLFRSLHLQYLCLMSTFEN